jgi:uracil-DNA glycosylase
LRLSGNFWGQPFWAAAANPECYLGPVPAEAPSARLWVPAQPTLPSLIAAAKRCEGCELYKPATQTVFGEGRTGSKLVLAGEQPGDAEDRAGRPFVGPAGRLLDRALEDAGINRESVYVTNAVKHFRFEERGKRRIHKKPTSAQIVACRPWLEAELAVIRPAVVIALGATAVQSLAGRNVHVLRDRGKLLESPFAKGLLVTIHPSALLRMPDRSQFDDEYAQFVADLAVAQKYAK